MSVVRLVGLLFFALACCVVIVLVGGGWVFVRRPVGVSYLTLWSLWWLLIAIGRQRGVPSTYDRSQRLILALGIVALVGLIVLPPWEYAHLSGPIPRDGPLAWLGLGVFAAGILLQATAFRALHGLYTSRLGIQAGHRLVTRGAYRLVRHPGYLSNLLCLIGIGLSLSSLAGLGLALFVVPLIVRRIQSEEAMLAAAFGEEYERYRQRVPWRLVPYVF
ncbi:MAG: isoprenylcysteine carboxylmethyltransferase family protein [Anaerolineaceae bacterium]|nr:isoprenylcysteine carboxylmethyltransferase family protein [Anaerolineaceae bacterium]